MRRRKREERRKVGIEDVIAVLSSPSPSSTSFASLQEGRKQERRPCLPAKQIINTTPTPLSRETQDVPKKEKQSRKKEGSLITQ